MKLDKSKFKKNWLLSISMRIPGLIIVAIFFIGKENGYEIGSSIEMIVAIIVVVMLAVGFYIQNINEPFAEIVGNKLIINGVTVEKDKIHSMEYLIKNKRNHILRASIDGYSEWELPLTKEDVEIDDLAVYKFIKSNFYPLELVKQ